MDKFNHSRYIFEQIKSLARAETTKQVADDYLKHYEVNITDLLFRSVKSNKLPLEVLFNICRMYKLEWSFSDNSVKVII